MSKIKLWDLLEVDVDRTDPRGVWWLSNNNRQYELEDIDPKQIEAMILMADTNGYNQYYRYFFWYKDSDDRKCVITHDWILREDLCKLVDKQIIETQGVKFIVDDRFKQDYVKIFKRVHSSNKLIVIVTVIFVFVAVSGILCSVFFNRSEA